GELARASDGVLRVAQELVLLIHQPGLPIASFPQSLAVSSLLGISDAKKVRERFTNSDPLPQPCDCPTFGVSAPSALQIPLLWDADPQEEFALPPGEEDGFLAPDFDPVELPFVWDSNSLDVPLPSPFGDPEDIGDGVFLNNGAARQQVVPLTIPGRGFDWQ